jgi:hypothetical protein
VKKPKPDVMLADPPPRAHNRPPPVYAGDMPKTCGNCEHFRSKVPNGRDGRCGNGISGKLTTRRIDGCAYGFYPSIEQFPLKAGPGGIR